MGEYMIKRPALWELKQDCFQFKTSAGYIARPYLQQEGGEKE